METTPSDDVRPLSIGAALRRGWWLVVGGAVLLGGLAGAAASTGTPSYTSATSVFLQPIAGNALSPDATVNGQQVLVAMQTEAGLVDSPDVLSTVGSDLGIATDKLRSAVKATVPSNTKTVRISYRARTPEAAAAGAAEFAKAFLSFREAQATQAQGRQLTKLKAQSAATLQNLKDLASNGGSSPADKASQQVLASRLASIQASIAGLISTDTYPGNVSSAATVPGSPDGFSPLLLMIAAGLLGAGLGAVVAVWRQAVDDRVGLAAGPRVAGLPVLSVLRRRRGAGVPVITDAPATDEVGEGFRQLKIGMVSVAPTAKSFSLSHVSSTAQTGASTANLGITMATAGHRIVLVDGSAPGTPGSLLQVLGDRLTPGATARSAQRLSIPGGGDVLVVSAAPTNDEAVDETRLAQLIRNQARRADYVLVAGPSLATADGELTCLATDATVLVAEQDRTRTADVQVVLDRAEMLGVEVCGLFTVPRGSHAHRRWSPFRRSARRPVQVASRAPSPAPVPAAKSTKSAKSAAVPPSAKRPQAVRSRPVVDKS